MDSPKSTVVMYGLTGRGGWFIHPALERSSDELGLTLYEITFGVESPESWMPVDMVWGGETEPIAFASVFASFAWKPGVDDRLDEMFADFDRLPLGGDAAGWFVPWLESRQILADQRRDDTVLTLQPGVANAGAVLQALGIGPVYFGDSSFSLDEFGGIAYPLWSSRGDVLYAQEWRFKAAHGSVESARPAVVSRQPDPGPEVHLGWRVAAGFDTRDKLIDWIQPDPEEPQIDAAALVDAALAAHVEEQREWVRPTDCDRLDAAFAELREAGWIAVQFDDNPAAAIHAAYDAGADPKGCVFTMEVDVELALDIGVLRLHHDPLPGGPPQLSRVREVVDALVNQGLTVEWGGSANDPISVPVTWHRWRDEHGSSIDRSSSIDHRS